jgi:hypothetical protein
MQARAIGTTYAAHLESKENRPAVHAGGRMCAAPGCSTTLSIYNPERTCFVHSKTTFPYRPSPSDRSARLG